MPDYNVSREVEKHICAIIDHADTLTQIFHNPTTSEPIEATSEFYGQFRNKELWDIAEQIATDADVMLRTVGEIMHQQFKKLNQLTDLAKERGYTLEDIKKFLEEAKQK